jgi:hypothetical protein
MDPITPEVLESLARRRRFSVRTLDAARRLLVDGAPARTVADEFGLHLSRIYALRRQVLAAAQQLRRPPAPAAATALRMAARA